MPDTVPCVLREIRAGDIVKKLSLGDSCYVALKVFLQKQALNFHHSNIAKTYVLVPEKGAPIVHGYVTLLCSDVELEGAYVLHDCLAANGYQNLPAVKIARLATDTSMRGQGYGTQMVELAIAIAKEEIMSRIGCRFVIVEAKKPAIEFYSQIGFTLLDTKANKKAAEQIMFIDLSKI